MRANKLALLAVGGVVAGLTLRKVFSGSGNKGFKGKVALITGGSKGLGIAIARRFGKAGCKLALCARDADELETAKADLESRGATVFTHVCDVTSQKAVHEMIAAVEAHYGEIDILVNNAGQISVGPVINMKVEDFDAAMKVMFWGVVYPTLELMPAFVKRKQGRIVNITSIGGKVSVPHLVPYTCAKFAATGFSEGIRSELLDKGVAVTTIAPGLMRTGSFGNALFKGDKEAEARWFSLSASAPLFTEEADDAADEIFTATERGEAERVLTGPAKLLSKLHGLMPGTTADILGVVAGLLLPATGPKGKAKAGSQIPFVKSPLMEAMLTLGLRAAKNYLQKPRAPQSAR